MLISELFDLSKTIAAPLFDGHAYPWECLSEISDFILALGATLPEDKFDNPSEGVWIAKDAKVFPSAYIGAPCIIDSGAEVRHCAFIRGSAIVGKGAVVGNSTELKNVVLFDGVQVPHYNYVGDSILGNKAHMGAGSICSNLKTDGKAVVIHGDEEYETGLRKIGAILADGADIGCGCVLNPGTVIGKNTSVYPKNSLRGVFEANCIVKAQDNIVERRN